MSTSAFQGIQKNSPTYYLEMTLPNLASKFDLLQAVLTDVKSTAIWNNDWSKVEQLGPVVDKSMLILNVNDRDTLKRLTFSRNNKLYVYFSSVPDAAVSDRITRGKKLEEISIDLTYEMWKIETTGDDIQIQRLKQVNFGAHENW